MVTVEEKKTERTIKEGKVQGLEVLQSRDIKNLESNQNKKKAAVVEQKPTVQKAHSDLLSILYLFRFQEL